MTNTQTELKNLLDNIKIYLDLKDRNGAFSDFEYLANYLVEFFNYENLSNTIYSLIDETETIYDLKKVYDFVIKELNKNNII